jgi:hypothetical protein
MKWTTTMTDYADGNIAEWSAFLSSTAMACKREQRIYFFFYMVFFYIIIFLLLFQNFYKSYSLHDYKLKNTQECIAHMLTSKPMYKENKCMWGCITWCKSCTTITLCVCVRAPKT